MRRAALLLPLLAACASAPQPKMSWGEAGMNAESEENAAEKPISAEELMARQKLGPLAQSTLRFGGVERAIRAQAAGQGMPADAVKAWSGIFEVIDQVLAGKLKAKPNELLRAGVACDAELDMDRQAYWHLPDGLEPAVQARMRALSQKLHGKAARHVEEDPQLSWPVHPAVITSLFGPRLDPIDHQTWKRHEGVDIAATTGELVTAADRGVVTEAALRNGYGLVVTIRHADGTLTRYGHLSQLLTRQGLPIERGGAVGLAGSTGRSTGPHVHFEVWRHGRALDPLEACGDPDAPDVAKYISSN